MNRKKMLSPVFQRSLFLSGLLVFSGLFWSCSDESPVVKEKEEEEEAQSTYSVAVRDGSSEMPPGGGMLTAQYSDYTSGCDLGKMADNKPDTRYEVPYKSFYVMWTCTKSAFVNYYSLTSANSSPESDPKSWILFGSNDKKDWTSLDERNDQKFTKRGEVKEFAITNEKEYKYYKLDIKANQGASNTHIAEWAMNLYSVKVGDGISNMHPGGGVITPQYPFFTSGNDVGMMVDSKPETKFITPYKSFYILWTSSDNTLVNHYSITSANDSPDSDPKSWTLYASYDQKQWISLDEQNDQKFNTRGEEKQYGIDNDAKYKYYKLEIKANQGASSTQIAEWAMRDISVIVGDGISYMPFGGGVIKPQYANFVLGSDVGMMVDGNLQTKYATPYKAFYVLWTNSKSALVNYYSISSADNLPESDPKSWTLYASNDKKIWTSLDKQSNQKFNARRELKEYSIDNKVEYMYYKLEIEDNWGASSTQIAEWGMQELYTNIDELMPFSGGSSYSPLTPMGSHYANRHTTTAQDRIWLLDPANEPPAPGSASHLYASEFPVNLYPFGKPLPADVNQHAIGNCGGVAAMASMAYIYPDFIESIIKDNGDKTYTVSMFDPQGKPVEVTVSNLFLTGNGRNIDAVSGKNNTATWSTVLEKAIMKYNIIYKVNTDIGGIGSEHVLPLFTGDGNSFAFSPGSLTGKQLARVVSVCLRQGKLIIGGFNRGDLPIEGSGSKTVTAHAYSLMHSVDRKALFAMRNPWGGNPDVDGTADGVLNIPDNSSIPPTIDLRIVNPGIAANFGDGISVPYTPPSLKFSESRMRVASYLLRPDLNQRVY